MNRNFLKTGKLATGRLRWMYSFLLLYYFTFNISAQCPNDNTLWIDITPPTCPGTNNTTCIFGGEYVTVSVVSGQTYVFQTCGDTDFDTEITLYNNSGGAAIAYNDDACGTQSSITWLATFSGVVRVLVDQYPCTDVTTCMTLSVSCSPACANYSHPTAGMQNTYLGACMVSTCCANVYDNGGSGGNYSDNINQVYRTFCPSQPGNCIRANFTSMSIEPQGGANCYDWLAVLNGPTQNSPMLWAGCDVIGSPNTLAGAWSNPFTSSDASGCLGFMFYSDNVVNQAGWAATISCVPCAGGPSATSNSDCPNFNSICGNSPVTGSSSGPGLTSECSGCVVSENYTNWYQFYIGTSGNLRMTIQPVNPNDDYDFSIWGPNVSCANINSTSPLRCSYAAADLNGNGSSDNGNGYTGLNSPTNTSYDNGTAAGTGNNAGSDISEDVLGNGWANDLPVTAGQTYLLMINGWSASAGGYTISWSGSTATLGTPPGSVTVQSNNTCPGQNQGSACAVINAGLPPFNYSWSTGSSASCINTLSPGTYTVTVTDGSGCNSTSTGTIGNFGSPTPTANPVNTGCAGTCNGSATVSSTGGSGSYSYNWSTGATGTTVSNLCEGPYSVTSTDGNGCTGTTTYSISATSTNSTAPSSVTASINPLCPGTTVTLTQNGGTLGTGASYNWYTGSCGGTFVASGNSISVTPVSTTTYYVLASGNCNTTACASVTLTVNSNSAAPTSASASINPVCAGNSVTLTQSGGTLGTGASYNWYSGSCGGTFEGSGSSLTVNPTSATTYYVLASGTCNTTSCASVTVSVNDNSTAPSSISASANPLCAGTATTLTQNGGILGTGASYNWYSGSCGGTFEGSGNSITINPTSPTTYYVLASGTCNTSGCASLAINVNQYPDATITPVGALCPGDPPLTLNAATGGGTFSGPGVTGSSFSPSSAGVGSHTITYTVTISGCTSTDTEVINVNSSSDATITSVPPLCTGDAPVTLSAATVGGTFTGPGVLGNTFDPAAAGAGTHIVTYTISGSCGSSDTETITVGNTPNATITAAGPFCTSDAATILNAATSGGTWSGNGITNASTGAFNPSSAGAGTHTITYSVTSGSCTGTDTEIITVNATPDATITAAGPYCSDASPVNLSAATPGGTWSGNGITNPATGTFDPAVAGGGSHSISYSISSGGCTGNDTETILVNAAPDATITPVGALCPGDATVTLNAATPGGTFSGPGVAGNTFDPATAGIGSHTITYTVTSNGCSDTDTEIITVSNSTDPTITAAGPFCTSDSPINLSSATAGGTWTGNGITSGASGTFNPSVAGAGSHTITYTISGSCGSSDTETVVVNASPDATITPVNPLCTGDVPVTLTSTTAGGTFTGTGVSGNTFDPSASGAGTFTITYDVTSNGCSSQDTETIIVNSNSDATINPAGPFCTGDSPFALSAASSGGVFTGNGVSGNLFDPALAGAGTHTITYIISGSCGDTGTVDITVSPSNDATINSSGPYCTTDAPVNLTAASPGGTWSGNGITNPAAGTFNPSVAGTGTHLITYNISGACGSTDTIFIMVNQQTDATITPVNPLCTGDSPILLSAAQNGGTWSGTGVIGSFFDPSLSGPGDFEITYSFGGVCGSTDIDSITVNASADATIYQAGPFCENDAPINFTAAQGGGIWSGNGITNTSSGTFNPTVAGTGTHLITYTINGACGAIDTAFVLVSPNADATISTLDSVCTSEATIALIAAQGGGTWSGTGVSGNIFNPSVAGAGIHTITYTISGACGDADTEDILVNASADATINPVNPMCINNSPVNLTAFQSGGIWTGNGITNTATGTFNPQAAGPGTHMITYTINGNCGDLDTVLVIVNPPSDATITSTGPYCDDILSVNLTAVDNGGFWTGPGVTGSGFFPNSLTPGTYSVVYTIPGNCGDTDTVDLQVIGTPDATINDPGPLCDTTAVFNLTAIDPGGSWSGTGITNPASGTFDPSASGTGTFTIVHVNTNAMCSDTDSVVITVGSVPPAPTALSAVICYPELPVTLSASGSGGSLTWYYIDSVGNINTLNDADFVPAVADSVSDSTYTYCVLEQNGNCPSACTPVTLSVINLDASFTSPPDSGEIPYTVIFDNTSFGVDSNDIFVWSFGDGDSSNQYNPTHTFEDIGDYTITLTIFDSARICSDTYILSLHAKGSSSVLVPNIFSPNGDNLNDVFNLIYKNLISVEGEIYNRWGELIYKWSSVEAGWDGRTLSGTLAPDGVYYYLINATGTDEPEPKYYEFRGYVTLVR